MKNNFAIVLYLVFGSMCYVFSFFNKMANTSEEYLIKNSSVGRVKKDEISKKIINERTKRKVKGNPNSKWMYPIVYYVDDPLSLQLIKEALDVIQKQTCIRFTYIEYPLDFVSGFRFKYTGQCKSSIGKCVVEKWQLIEIGNKCLHQGGIILEVLHALGIYDEHCRVDKRNYVQIYPQNMFLQWNEICNDISSIDFNYHSITYDYGSITHSGIYKNSKNREVTIIPLDINYRKTVGQKERLSFNDIKMVNYHYCNAQCPNSITCRSEGYQDPNNCNVCKCIEGYTGKDCGKFEESHSICGNTQIMVGANEQDLVISGSKSCIYRLFALQCQKIVMNFEKVHMHPNEDIVCKYQNAIEIRHWKRKSASGARFCGTMENILLTSKDYFSILYYRSDNVQNYVKINLKAVK